MNTTDKILDILEYIERHPDKDAMLSDLRMTDTNEFQLILSVARGSELIDLANDSHIWYRGDELEENGYIHADNRLDVDITEIIDHVHKAEPKWCVIETAILEKLTANDEQLSVLSFADKQLIHALYDDGVLQGG
jgi:hypothetical protein